MNKEQGPTPDDYRDARGPEWRAIFDTLRDYRLSNMTYEGTSDEFYPLVDLMSNEGQGIDTGEMQMVELADEISLAVKTARRSSDEQAEVVGAALDRGEVLPKLANCGHYLAEDNTGQWHYINHANTWQTYPGPTTPEARAGVTEAMVEMAMSAYWGTSPGGRRTARDRMVDALLAALAVGDEGIREVLRDALRFISNIDNAHPVVRKLRAALKDAP